MRGARYVVLAAAVMLAVLPGISRASSYTFDGSDGFLDWRLALDTKAGFYGDGTSGSRLVWKERFGGTELTQGTKISLGGGVTGKISDYIQSDLYSSPGGPPPPTASDDFGEKFDVEAIFKTQDASGYHFLIITSTPEDLFTNGPGTMYTIGDLAINTNFNPDGSYLTPYEVELGVKLAGTEKGNGGQNATWGWNVDTTSATQTDQRDPKDHSGTEKKGGGNFDWDTGTQVTSGITVAWKQVLTGSDDPDRTSLWAANNTYAIQVDVAGSLLPNGVQDVALAPSCDNDWLHVEAPGFPPGVLLSTLPILGVVLRRFRRS